MRYGVGWALALSVAMMGCGREAPVPAAQAATSAPAVAVTSARPGEAARPPAHMDSAVPRAVALERFRQGSPRVTELEGGAGSRDELVHRFARAVAVRDTAALRRLLLSRAEFAWLYYPTSKQGLPPYDLSPDLMWFMTAERSQRGAAALMSERAGQALRLVGYRCLGDSTVEGANRLWGPCVIRRVQAPGDTVEERLFGPVIERGGRFKFVSYSNRLD